MKSVIHASRACLNVIVTILKTKYKFQKAFDFEEEFLCRQK